jgi:hypothetical protein
MVGCVREGTEEALEVEAEEEESDMWRAIHAEEKFTKYFSYSLTSERAKKSIGT